MPKDTGEEKTYEISIAKVLRDELNHIKYQMPPNSSGESVEKLSVVLKEFYNSNLSALCFSGGGIRSATFGLGIVQALAKHGLLDKFDYLSTVSGGGYLGSWLSAWIRREQMGSDEQHIKRLELLENKIFLRLEKKNLSDARQEELKRLKERISVLALTENLRLFEKYKKTRTDGIESVQEKLRENSISDSVCPNPEPKQLQYLREYSNYMSPRVGLLSADTWTFLSIYVRNLFLNWTIFIPLIAAILLIPRIFFAFTKIDTTNWWLINLMLPIGLLAGSLAVRFTINKLPSKNTDTPEIKHNTDGWVLGLGILPLLVLAFAATTFWAWYNRLENAPKLYFDVLPSPLNHRSIYFIIFTVLIFVFGYLLFHLTKRPWVKLDWRGILAATASSAVGGLITWLVVNNLFDTVFFARTKTDPYYLPLYVCIAVPVYLLTFSISSIIFVGLSSMFVTDDDREWLARQGAWILIVCGAWFVINSLVLFGPSGFESFIENIKNLISGEKSLWFDYVKTSILPIIVTISGFLSLVGGFSGKSLVKDQPTKSKLSKFLSVAPQIAAVVFLAFLLIALAYVSSIVLALSGNFLAGFLGKFLDWSMLGNITHLNVLSQAQTGYLFVWLIILSTIGIGMAFFINVNKFSLHGTYRDRLIRAYLGASHANRKGNKFTGFDDSDNFQLHRIKGQKPFHIINATLNLVAGKNLAWQNRKAASFTMSPLHCGSWLLGYRFSNEYNRNKNLTRCAHLRFCNKLDNPCPLVDKSCNPLTDNAGNPVYGVENCQFPGKALRLGTAMAISGAAANPNMGYYSSPVVTFLMSLFNIRLGWWLGNTGKTGDKKDSRGIKFYTKSSPSIAVLPLINETFGQTDETKRYLNVTDGGHFENLGIYEMVLRRCKLIVVSDAAADENFTFGEISNAVEKCKVDLGVDIKFNEDIKIYARNIAKDFADRQYFAIAEIIYPETNQSDKKDKSYLLYIRPTYYETEPTDIKHYANSNEKFPHQSTADQLYDEKQFEAYRALGFFTMEEIIEKTKLSDFLKNL